MKQGWEIKKLGDFIKEHSIRNKSGVEYPVYSVTNSQGFCKDYFSKEVASKEKRTYKIVPFGCFAYNPSRINVGSVDWQHCEENVIVSPLYVVFSISKDVMQEFLLRYLKSNFAMSLIDNFARGTVRANLKFDTLCSFPIAIPSREEQERIVAELDCLSGVIEHKREQLRELDALAQSIFYQMFGDPITNEKGWEVKKVIDVVKMQRGFDLPVQDRDNDGTIPIYGSNGIIGCHTIHKANFGIITGRSGTLGEVYSSNEPFWPLNTTLFSVDTHGNNVIFLKYIMANFHLERFKAGAGVPTLNRNEFHNEPIPNIPLTLQQEFAKKIEAIEKQKELIKQSITQTEELFNSRMDYYFN